jgi:hypothetical protein
VGNPQIGAAEVHITLLELTEYRGKLPGKLVIKLPSLDAAAIPFDAAPLPLSVTRQLPKFSARVASQFTKDHATASFEGSKAEPTTINLAPLFDNATARFDLSIANAKATIEIALRVPLVSKAMRIKLVEYHCSPLLIQDNIAPAAPVSGGATPGGATPPPRHAAAATAPPRGGFQQIRILPKEERERFWGPGVIDDYFIQIGRVSIPSYRSHHVPTAELEEQVAYFQRRRAELDEQFEMEGFDQDAFMNQIRESIAREVRYCAAAPPAIRGELEKRILVMQSELESLEAELAGGGD